MKITLRIWILIIVLILALLSIAPWNFFKSGVEIKSVERNSSAFDAGLRPGMIIKNINNIKINSQNDVNQFISLLNNSNESTKLTIKTNSETFIFLANSFDIQVGKIPSSNIKTGLDLSGGARALVKPVNASLSSSQINDLIAITNERFNNFGLKDITVRSVSDLEGNNYMLVEIAGATPADLQSLLAQQGKFDAKIGNETVFSGGKNDIADVCRTDATCSRIESCQRLSSGGYYCKFSFVVYLTEDAAKRHADITSKLGVNITDGGRFLDKKIDFYLDNNLVDSLLISEDLKGRVATQIAISGPGYGNTHDDALKNAQENMKKLQTVLLTGSLPYKLEIVKLDTISPFLGSQFTKNIVYLALIVFVIISLILFLKYRKIKITLSVILTVFSEAFITLGIAALIRWNLDAPSIAGIIAGLGTGVNDQIVLIDESVSNVSITLGEKMKRGFFIILGAFFTIIAAMIPLFWAGAGMLRGFALTTIIGVCVGIIITRPAFADILRQIQE